LRIRRRALRPGSGRQRGAALVCALVLMLAAMLVAVSACRAVFASIASAGAGRERSIAHAAAEAALRDAERDIAGADPARATLFTAAGASAFVDACGRGGNSRGLCLAGTPPAWQTLDLAEPGHPALVPYGYYTGALMASGKGLLTAHPPAYLIEKIEPPGAGASLGSFYRVTAVGFGSREQTRVVLQSVVRKPAPSGGASGSVVGPGAGAEAGNGPEPPAAQATVQLPEGRISWREIANWPQLHAQALE
jgi:type IV pilus assembly protein PilX